MLLLCILCSCHLLLFRMLINIDRFIKDDYSKIKCVDGNMKKTYTIKHNHWFWSSLCSTNLLYQFCFHFASVRYKLLLESFKNFAINCSNLIFINKNRLYHTCKVFYYNNVILRFLEIMRISFLFSFDKARVFYTKLI